MTTKSGISKLRELPQIDEVLAHPSMTALAGVIPHEMLAQSARETVDRLRKDLLDGGSPAIDIDSVANSASANAAKLMKPSLRRAINATGVIIHTNLGRSVLAPQAQAAVCDAMAGYSTLEYDTETLSRGSRHSHYEKLVCALTGAEAAIAVNNNAAAVLMVLSEFASGREAIVSRGEQVEIGGSFRIPDIMELSGARMVEVGTTNRTHLSDYQRAVGPDTAMLLKVHPSNYRLVGFTESVPLHELRQLADEASKGRESRVLVYEDQGSGSLLPLDCADAAGEPTVGEVLRQGADLVSFSGDKLLGGPQAGIVVGSRELVGRLKSNPLARALRLDKMSIAALEATLRLYLDPEAARKSIPTLRMVAEPLQDVKARAQKLQGMLEKRIPAGCARLSLVEETSRAGGGALPELDIPTVAVEVGFRCGSAQECEHFLVSSYRTPIVCRIKQEALIVDVRTVADSELDEVAEGLAAYFESIQGGDDGR